MCPYAPQSDPSMPGAKVASGGCQRCFRQTCLSACLSAFMSVCQPNRLHILSSCVHDYQSNHPSVCLHARTSIPPSLCLPLACPSTNPTARALPAIHLLDLPSTSLSAAFVRQANEATYRALQNADLLTPAHERQVRARSRYARFAKRDSVVAHRDLWMQACVVPYAGPPKRRSNPKPPESVFREEGGVREWRKHVPLRNTSPSRSTRIASLAAEDAEACRGMNHTV
jgi:hypothetical protein